MSSPSSASRRDSDLAAGSPQSRLPLILRRLRRTYDLPAHARQGDPLDSLIGTLLSQNTTDVNSHQAFRRLKERFPTWQQAMEARPASIAAAIRPGGLGEVKSRRIKQILRRIEEDRGALDLSFLRRLPVPEARDYLLSLPGIGPKTAACVLLFSLAKPAFPVDTHVLRVSKRLGLLPPKTTLEAAHTIYAEMLDSGSPGRQSWDADRMLALHLGLIRHGREICVARRPRCEVCPLFEICPRVGVSGPAPAKERS